jgi:hypothetical protein
VRLLPRSKTVHGRWPRVIDAISFVLGPMKYYPASLEYMFKHKERLGTESHFDKADDKKVPGGAIEVYQKDEILFHFPLEF